jgi:hypothetical protein
MLLFLLVMTLNSEAKYSSGGGGDPLGSSIVFYLFLCAQSAKGKKIKSDKKRFLKKKKFVV